MVSSVTHPSYLDHPETTPGDLHTSRQSIACRNGDWGSLGVLHNYDFDSFKSLFQKNNGPQTDSREPLRGEHSQRNGPCGHNVGIPLHHLNGPMVFCSQTSVALEFQR